MEHEDFSGTLPQEFTAPLIEKYEMPTDDTKRFEVRLNHICGLFLQRRKKQKGLGTVSEQHAELNRVIKEAEKFATSLGAITDPMQQYLESTSYELNERDYGIDCMLYEKNNSRFDADEETRSTYPQHSSSFLDVRTLRAQIDLLTFAARYIRTLELGEQKTGPQVDRNLDIWIEDMRSLWISVVGRPFTRDEFNGVATSEAAQFCVEVIANISPEIPTQKVLNAMKKRITADHQFLHWKR